MSDIHALEVPKWGMTMNEGTLTEWLADEGQEVSEGTAIATLESSKISGELEAPAGGVLARRTLEVGQTAPVGALVAVVAPASTDEATIDEVVAGYSGNSPAAVPGSPGTDNATPATSEPRGSSSDVADSSTAGAPAPADSADGAPARRAAYAIAASPLDIGGVKRPGGVDIPTALRGTFDPDAPATPHAAELAETYGVDLHAVEPSGRGHRVTVADLQQTVAAAGGSLPFGNDLPRSATAGSRRNDAAVAATPRARTRAAELGVNLHDARPTGTRGRVTVYDVEAADWHLHGPSGLHEGASSVATGGTAPGTPGAPAGYSADTANAAGDGNPATERPLSAMRKVIASRLKESYLDSPAFRVTVTATIDRLLDLRKEINDSRLDTKISVNDLVVAATAKALIAVPEVNVQYDATAQSVKQFAHADIAVAVATEEGLITPIVSRADTRSITEISTVAADLATRAKAGTLGPDEFQGGTFTISNLGMFGVTQFDGIINPPSAAILAVAAGTKQFVPDTNGDPIVATQLPLTLTSDHRVVDGALAARFLAQLRTILESPALIFA